MFLKMATTNGVLERIESRIELIEKLIFGASYECIGETDTPEVVSSLNGVKQSLVNQTTGKERIHALWKRLDELNSSLDPEVADKLTLSEGAKADIILAEEEQLTRIAALLEKYQSLKGTLDSEHTKGAPAFHDKLQPLVTVQLDQKDRANKQSQDVKQLLEAYNNIVTLLSQQFVQWDALMTRYEITKKVRDPKEYY